MLRIRSWAAKQTAGFRPHFRRDGLSFLVLKADFHLHAIGGLVLWICGQLCVGVSLFSKETVSAGGRCMVMTGR